MPDVIVQLTDDASANYPFLFQVGDRVRSLTDGRKGAVKNGTFVGADHPGGSFEIVYDIQFDGNEDVVRIRMVDLEKVETP